MAQLWTIKRVIVQTCFWGCFEHSQFYRLRHSPRLFDLDPSIECLPCTLFPKIYMRSNASTSDIIKNHKTSDVCLKVSLGPQSWAQLSALSGGPELALRIPSKKSEGNPEPGDVTLGPGWKKLGKSMEHVHHFLRKLGLTNRWMGKNRWM